jgi:hypothetical protein
MKAIIKIKKNESNFCCLTCPANHDAAVGSIGCMMCNFYDKKASTQIFVHCTSPVAVVFLQSLRG